MPRPPYTTTSTNMRVLFKHPEKLLLGIFLILLVISYAGLAWICKTPFLLNEVLHEDGKQTLLALLFNPAHFLREIPTSISMCVACVGAFLFFEQTGTEENEPPTANNRIFILWILTLVIPLTAIILTSISDGIQSAWYELAQYRTRKDFLIYGSHWYYHFLHMLFIPLEALVICGFIKVVQGVKSVTSSRVSKITLTTWVVLFIFLSLLFGFRMIWTSDPLYLAHQLREIGTHGTLSVTFILGICFLVSRSRARKIASTSTPKGQSILRIFLITLPIALFIPIYLAWSLRNVDILGIAQRDAGYLELFFTHNFEHLIDYIFMGLFSFALYLSITRSK